MPLKHRVLGSNPRAFTKAIMAKWQTRNVEGVVGNRPSSSLGDRTKTTSLDAAGDAGALSMRFRWVRVPSGSPKYVKG